MMEHKGTKRLETQRLILRSFVPDQIEPGFPLSGKRRLKNTVKKQG